MLHPDEQARAYLWDIREAAREIAGFVRGFSFDGFEKNKVLRYVSAGPRDFTQGPPHQLTDLQADVQLNW